MKKTYMKPEISELLMDTQKLICYSVGGVNAEEPYGIIYGGIDDDDLDLDPE